MDCILLTFHDLYVLENVMNLTIRMRVKQTNFLLYELFNTHDTAANGIISALVVSTDLSGWRKTKQLFKKVARRPIMSTNKY